MGVFLSEPVPRGERLTLDANNAYDKIFGMVLLNDWSARATQIFEMGSALGPFHGKGSATSISPWIVPLEALQQSAAPRHLDVIEAKQKKLQEEEGDWQGEGKLEALEYLRWKSEEEEKATFDIELTAKIISEFLLFFSLFNFTVTHQRQQVSSRGFIESILCYLSGESGQERAYAELINTKSRRRQVVHSDGE